MIEHVHDFGEDWYIFVAGKKRHHIMIGVATLCGMDGYTLYPSHGETELCGTCRKAWSRRYAVCDGDAP